MGIRKISAWLVTANFVGVPWGNWGSSRQDFRKTITSILHTLKAAYQLFSLFLTLTLSLAKFSLFLSLTCEHFPLLKLGLCGKPLGGRGGESTLWAAEWGMGRGGGGSEWWKEQN